MLSDIPNPLCIVNVEVQARRGLFVGQVVESSGVVVWCAPVARMSYAVARADAQEGLDSMAFWLDEVQAA